MLPFESTTSLLAFTLIVPPLIIMCSLIALSSLAALIPSSLEVRLIFPSLIST